MADDRIPELARQFRGEVPTRPERGNLDAERAWYETLAAALDARGVTATVGTDSHIHAKAAARKAVTGGGSPDVRTDGSLEAKPNAGEVVEGYRLDVTVDGKSDERVVAALAHATALEVERVDDCDGSTHRLTH